MVPQTHTTTINTPHSATQCPTDTHCHNKHSPFSNPHSHRHTTCSVLSKYKPAFILAEPQKCVVLRKFRDVVGRLVGWGYLLTRGEILFFIMKAVLLWWSRKQRFLVMVSISLARAVSFSGGSMMKLRRLVRQSLYLLRWFSIWLRSGWRLLDRAGQVRMKWWVVSGSVWHSGHVGDFFFPATLYADRG